MTPLTISFETAARRDAAVSSRGCRIKAPSHIEELVRHSFGHERDHGRAHGASPEFYFGVQVA